MPATFLSQELRFLLAPLRFRPLSFQTSMICSLPSADNRLNALATAFAGIAAATGIHASLLVLIVF